METNKTGPVFPHPLLPRHPPLPPPPPPPAALSPDGLDSRISPSILLIIVILAVVFFVSGLLHLIVRYLLRPARRSPEDPDNLTALQGQLQQLFHLHDAGVDQSFIDSLPVFPYRAITGVKDPFDCAVCLCEFEAEDKLRLLPKCSHAFHLECIDTWLLSHSTCPLCRSSLLPDFPASCSPLVLVLDSGGESSREIAPDANAQLGPHVEEDPGQATSDLPQKTGETGAKEAEPTVPEAPEPPARVVPVKLGKFRNVDGGVAGVGEGSSSNSSNGNLDERRCFSMGSFEYVMDDSSLLHVAIKQPVGKHIARMPGHRPAMSECGCNSRREGHKAFSSARIGSNSQRRESLSISKIWLRSRSEKPSAREDGPRRVLSLRLPGLGMGAGDEAKLKCGSSRRTTASEPDGAWWVDKSGSELGLDVEAGGGGCNGTVASRAEETPSFARRTLLWLVGGRSPKVVNHS